jgi:hypothetical protein
MDSKENIQARKPEAPAKPIKKQIVEMLQRDEMAVCSGWLRRLNENAVLTGINLKESATEPLRLLLRDLVRVIEGKLPAAEAPPAADCARRLGALAENQLTLCQNIEVLLVGQGVVVRWAHAHLGAPPEDWFDLFEQIRRAFHQLERYYALRYCGSCVRSMTAK